MGSDRQDPSNLFGRIKEDDTLTNEARRDVRQERREIRDEFECPPWELSEQDEAREKGGLDHERERLRDSTSLLIPTNLSRLPKREGALLEYPFCDPQNHLAAHRPVLPADSSLLRSLVRVL